MADSRGIPDATDEDIAESIATHKSSSEKEASTSPPSEPPQEAADPTEPRKNRPPFEESSCGNSMVSSPPPSPTSTVSSSSSTTTNTSTHPSSSSSSHHPKGLCEEDAAVVEGNRELGRVAVKTVRFNDTLQVFPIESADDRTVEEWRACQYSAQDYSHFRDRERNFTRELSDCGRIFGMKDDVLGLETREHRYERRLRYREAVWAVKFETMFQSDYDPIRIAEVYSEYTEKSRRSARARAISNAAQVGQPPQATPSSSSYDPPKGADDGLTDDVDEIARAVLASVENKIDRPASISLHDFVNCTACFISPSQGGTEVIRSAGQHAHGRTPSRHASQDPPGLRVRGSRGIAPPQSQSIFRQGGRPPSPRRAPSSQPPLRQRRSQHPSSETWLREQHQHRLHYCYRTHFFRHGEQHHDPPPRDWGAHEEAVSWRDQALAAAGIIPPPRWTWNPIISDFVPTPTKMMA
jgi:hypothetical protein